MKFKMYCMVLFLLTVFLFLNFTAFAEPPVGNTLQDFEEMALGIFEANTDTLDLIPLLGIWENIDPDTGIKSEEKINSCKGRISGETLTSVRSNNIIKASSVIERIII